MTRQIDKLDLELDRALEDLRESRPADEAERAATARVWARLRAEIAAQPAEPAVSHRLRECADFQALIPAYLAETLPAARRLLVQDHLGECVSCRRVLRDARRPVGRPARVAERVRSSAFGWRIAAAAAVLLAVVGLSIKTDVFSFETGGMFTIESIQGEAYRVFEGGVVPVAAGDVVTLGAGESLRTAKGGSAILRLADDSQVEMRERSELAIRERHRLLPGLRADGVIDLDRGSVIVEASKQGSGHLYVATDDCRVAVQGTVFSVNHGTKGSRVSVLEGEVHVRHGSARDVLEPGEQVTTTAALEHVPLEEEIGWSQNVERYRAVLAELRAIGREVDRVLRPNLRYSTDLLDLAPADTAFYLAIPNVSGGLDDAYQILSERMAANPLLSAWWQEQFASTQANAQLQMVIDKLAAWGGELGDEIVVTLQRSPQGGPAAPLILARLTHPDGFADFLERELAELESATGEGPLPVELYEGPVGELPDIQPDRSVLYLWRDGSLLAAAPELSQMRHFAESRAQGTSFAAQDGSFRRSLAGIYAEGAEWVFGVDLGAFLHDAAAQSPSEGGTLEELGLLDVRHLIAERRHLDDATQSRAVLTFDRERRGLAALLAAPAPVGSLDYVSPDASVAAAFVMQDMERVVDELFRALSRTDPAFEQRLAEFEHEHGIDVRRDLAAPLGGEFAVAIDGPLLPIPSWKLVMEVYDPEALERSLEWVVNEVGAQATEHGFAGLALERESAQGRDYLHIRSLDTGLGVYIVFDDGYLVAGPSRAILDRALQTRASGASLVASSRFAALLPQDDHVNFSGVVYQNLGPVIDPLASQLSGRIPSGTGNGPALLQALGSDLEPALAVIYGEPDRIVLVSRADGGIVGSLLGSLAGSHGLFDLEQSMLRTLEEQAQQTGSPARDGS